MTDYIPGVWYLSPGSNSVHGDTWLYAPLPGYEAWFHTADDHWESVPPDDLVEYFNPHVAPLSAKETTTTN